ncbi:ABC transporter substrate-binding protein [Inquilinus sp.]|jgi:multiple sugar transport system substrate-binding protein|uniref:ABC transporter substrate-binding protein n=1 Tax=Inquilinus sp. TaxID=1932117 RepID=UPI003783D6B4
MTATTKIKDVFAVAGLAALLMTGGASFAWAEDVTLSMAVPDWPPTRVMKKFFDEQYKPKSGNTVKLDVDFIPWPDFYTRVNASLTSGEQKYNFIVSDSQWLGAFVEGGYFRKINDLLDADPDFKKAFMEIHPNPLNAYATYPYKSDNYYGFPQFPDVLVTYGRKDVLCDETEQKNFTAKYQKKLPCTGEEIDAMTWDDFRNVGEFFRRKKGEMLAGKPADDDFYGIAFQAGKAYDFSSMQVNGLIWQMGGDIWDETQVPKGQAEGVVNSPIAVKALETYLSLIEYMPPVARTGTMDIFKSDELFREGKVAMNVDWIGLGEASLDPKTSKVSDKLVFGLMPGTIGADGKMVRWSNIGGQPFVLTTWTTDAQIKEAVDFVKWWLSPAIQHQFAAAGGQSAIKSVYSDPKYVTYRPWNRAWAPSLDWQKDVWHVPQFFELLTQQQDQLDLAITGKQDAKATLDNIAKFQQNLLTEAGLIQ